MALWSYEDTSCVYDECPRISLLGDDVSAFWAGGLLSAVLEGFNIAL